MTKAEEIAKVIHRRLCAVALQYKEWKPAVALSGGVDSCAVLAALMEIGCTPTIYSYRPSTHYSTDFLMAQETASNLALEFVPVVIEMNAVTLDELVRTVISFGYSSKVQAESLPPLLAIARASAKQGDEVLFTGDQSDGYFMLSRWSKYDKDMEGVDAYSEERNIRRDTDSVRIDRVRTSYYRLDKSCSGAIAKFCRNLGIESCFPFRDKKIFEAFLGSTWLEVNKPRIKEPVKLAFADWFHDQAILTRKVQVNLHKGDSKFGNTLAEILLQHYNDLGYNFNSARGLYGAIARGTV